MKLSKELDLPVIIHDREAHEDTMTLLKKYRPKGVVHCFSGSVEMAQEVLKLGMYIGLGGAVTFKNAKKPVAVAASPDISRILMCRRLSIPQPRIQSGCSGQSSDFVRREGKLNQ